jgi:polysaccharide export outer membrane protein
MNKSKSEFTRLLGRSVLTLAFCVSLAQSQAPTGPVSADTSLRQGPATSDAQLPSGSNTPQVAIDGKAQKAPEHVTNYVLGPEDQIVIHAFQAEELSEKPIQITGDGYINLPLIGKVKAGGLSVSDLELDLTERLKIYVKDPQVSVFVADYRSQPVSVVGDIAIPGIVQLRGRKTLVEVIALAGGLKADAGNSVTITRQLSNGRIPLPDATDSPDGQFSMAHVNLHDVMEGKDTKNNLLIEPNDVIMIPKARLLYVVGEVQKPGGYVLSEKDSLTVLQAVALAGGFTQGAAPKKARILYQHAGQPNRTEVATNVRKIMDGQAPDIDLHAEDILYVPSNLPKSVGGKALETALNMAGVAVWRF